MGTPPYFDCSGVGKPTWKITYASPFFGWNSLRNRIEFKGAVAVSMDIKMLDVNQCPNDYHTPNAFKRTHKCDEKSSYCVPILGRGFGTGGYKCECKQGYEYMCLFIFVYICLYLFIFVYICLYLFIFVYICILSQM